MFPNFQQGQQIDKAVVGFSGRPRSDADDGLFIRVSVLSLRILKYSPLRGTSEENKEQTRGQD